jgi:hypothetical protein
MKDESRQTLRWSSVSLRPSSFRVEASVFLLIVLVLLLWVVLAVLLTGWSAWFQSAIYTESATGIVWRGPVAASAITVVVVVWVVLAYRMPGRFEPFWESASSDSSKRFDELRVPGADGKEEVFKRRPNGEYRSRNAKPLPATPPRIIVDEDGQRYTFEPERDEQGHFKRHKIPGGDTDEPLIYRDEKGRVMQEGALGRLVVFRVGRLIGSMLLHLALFASVFLGLWLLLRFQWAHALGQAVVLCLLLLLFVMPQLLTRAEKARSRAAAPAAPLAGHARRRTGPTCPA